MKVSFRARSSRPLRTQVGLGGSLVNAYQRMLPAPCRSPEPMKLLQALVFLGLLAAATRAAALPPAPRPPPPADDAILRTAIRESTTCFSAAWEPSRQLRFQAEAAVRRPLGPPGSPNWTSARDVVEQYLLSRRALRACVAKLTDVMALHNYTGNDALASSAALSGMDFNYGGQDRYEMAVLASLIDPEEGRLIIETRYPSR